MKKTLFITSLVINILLIASMFGIRAHYHKMIFQMLYDISASQVHIHENMLAELKSEDEHKVVAVQTMLEQNIRDGNKAAEMWKAASERTGLW